MGALRTIGVIGGGAWGTALANAAAASGKAVALWMRDPEAAAAAELSRTNERYLPGVRLLDAIGVTSRPQTLALAETVLLVVPTQNIRSALAGFAGLLPPETPLVLCAKGIERGTNLFPSEIVRELRPEAPVAVLSGPSFAADVARGLPTAVALASGDEELARRLAADLSGPALRVYHGSDMRGVEIGGAAKNVLAIAVGIVQGRRLGESAKAALTARGFAELLRFAEAFGGRPHTLMGLSGLGDLVLTCGSAQSRNFSLGLRIGAGTPARDATGGKLAEGAFTADALVDLARSRSVEMPISEAVAAVLAGTRSVDEAVDGLMARPLKAE
ncbi:NAD(P)H-dependent glycerol-3-phosphate dehydrogenase [Enterovirga aerilata]|uniref:Glycerol-3-phosphate dehydrogenase [NAD(P)+] n=1 Tax=Enterovirga aerilata TaxID=2730920 RepID=A0A849IC29_9HYPH|nr:NAD(P)-dependent glycerol-3-phosphate dehydrogenase [Enterovirga sp. DB1703]